MDQQLKARLIGGAVLVTLIVLLAPELLSGRKPSEPELPAAAAGGRAMRTFTIELGGGAPATTASKPATAEPQPEPERPPATPAATASPSAAIPEPKTASNATTEPRATPPSPATRSEPPDAVAPTAAATPEPAASVKGGWAVQVGAFGSAATARKLANELNSAGYRAFLSPVTRSGKTLNRVRVGPEDERADADRLAARLKARGLPATVVAND